MLYISESITCKDFINNENLFGSLEINLDNPIDIFSEFFLILFLSSSLFSEI